MLRLISVLGLVFAVAGLLLTSQSSSSSASPGFTPTFTETADEIAPDDPFVLPVDDDCVVGEPCKIHYHVTVPASQPGYVVSPGRNVTVTVPDAILSVAGDLSVPDGAIVARSFGSEYGAVLGGCGTPAGPFPYDALNYDATIDHSTTTNSPTDLSSFLNWPVQLDGVVSDVLAVQPTATLHARWIDASGNSVLIFQFASGGGMAVGIIGDPTQTPLTGNCGPIDANYILLGQTLDNPSTAGIDEGGYPLYACSEPGTATYELAIDRHDTPPGDTEYLFDTVTCSANTPAGSGVTVPLLGGTTSGVGGIDLTYSNVTTAGSSSVTGANTGPPPPTGFQVVGLNGAPFFYDVNTTATFTGPVTLCVHYDETGLTPAEEDDLRLMQNDGAGFVDRTTTLDTVANIICAEAPSFSIWAVMIEQEFPPPGPPVVGGIAGLLDGDNAVPSAHPSGSSATAVAALAALGAAVLAAASTLAWRRRRARP